MKNKILAVDDEEHIAQLVKVTLERVGYSVRTAPNGVKALEMVTQECPDLIILDVMMPRMNGFEVLSKLKAAPSTAQIPVIMLTVRTADSDTSEAWYKGIDMYMSKPFDSRELAALVSRFLPLDPDSSLTPSDSSLTPARESSKPM